MERNGIYESQPGRSGRHSPAVPSFQMLRPDAFANVRSSRSVDGRAGLSPSAARGIMHFTPQPQLDMMRAGYPTTSGTKATSRTPLPSPLTGSLTPWVSSASFSLPGTPTGLSATGLSVASSSTPPSTIRWARSSNSHTSASLHEDAQTPVQQKAPHEIGSLVFKTGVDTDETPPKLTNPSLQRNDLLWDQISIPTPQRMSSDLKSRLVRTDHTPTTRSRVVVSNHWQGLRSSEVASMERDETLYPMSTLGKETLLQPRYTYSFVDEKDNKVHGELHQQTDTGPLPDFSVTDARYGSAAASRSLDTLPHSIRHALNFITHLPALPCTETNAGLAAFLPAQRFDVPRPTLVLDLDETLVHCTRGEGKGSTRVQPKTLCPPDVVVDFEDVQAHGSVAFRPFARFFLEMVAKEFEVVVFTASQQFYADKVCNALDPNGQFIHYRLYRQHCTELRGAFFKELGLLGRPLRQCLLVDNSPISVACNANNGILCRSWYDDPTDQELMDLYQIVRQLRARGGGADEYLAQRYGLGEFFKALREGAGDLGTVAPR